MSTFLSFRIDLTQDKRFSLNTSTIKLLKNIQDPMLFTIYLDGDFPSGFQRLKLESLRLLEEFRAENPNIKYILVNPSENSDSQARRDTYTQLKNSGLSAIQIKVEEQDGVKEQQIFPGAIVSYQDKEWPVSLLMDQFASNPEAQINASIQNLEYSLATSVKGLTDNYRRSIGILH
jgi:ABC-2 type transport system permease protein